MKKTIVLLSICSFAYYGGTLFASINDCGVVNNIQNVKDIKIYQDILSTIQQKQQQNFSTALPADALQKAFENLKKFCCSSSQNDDCKGYKEKQGYPLSPFLYDHLIDISLRRLDALPEFAYGLPGDETGIKRRNFITQAATGKQSPQAKDIAAEYEKYRKTKTTINEQSKAEDIQSFLQKYNTPEVSLVDKYNTVCKVMKEAYNDIVKEKILIDDDTYNSCQTIVAKRINNEYIYTKTIMIKTANEGMHEVYTTYTMKYFVQEKIMGLIDLISQIKSLFSTMVNQAATAKTCSK